MDLVPAQFDRVKILRDPAYNVASWNITQRRVSGSVPDDVLCEGRPLRFYHFSGVNSKTPERMHRLFAAKNKTLDQLVRWYRTECEREGERELRNYRWHYANYDDGTPVTRPQQLWYRDNPPLQARFPNPFATGVGSYYEWLTTKGPGLKKLEGIFPQTIESLQEAVQRLRRIEKSRLYKVYARVRRLVRAA
jgi:hypothetical protein